jgi:hypothetical protein
MGRVQSCLNILISKKQNKFAKTKTLLYFSNLFAKTLLYFNTKEIFYNKYSTFNLYQ